MNQTLIAAEASPQFTVGSPPTRGRLCLSTPPRQGWPALARPMLAAVDRMLGLKDLDDRYQRLPASMDYRDFLTEVLNALRVEYVCDDDEVARIPTSGPVIVIANHPFGGLDGVIITHLLAGLRSDLRVLANGLLARIIELQPVLIPVKPFGGIAAHHPNVSGTRTALRFLQAGGMLFTFPAGVVSHFRPSQPIVMDPPWSQSIALLARRTGATVVPLFVQGRNSNLFQVSGLMHPWLRTALLARELLNKRGSRIELRIGKPISAAKLGKLASDEAAMRFLRAQTYLLGSQRQPSPEGAASFDKGTGLVPLRSPVNAALMKAEIDNLPVENCLLTSGCQRVFYAEADQIPWIIQEIGRLRELSFRAVGEGTGQAADIDLYDAYYLQLFIWDDTKSCVVGGYRLGRIADILARFGRKGLYTHSLFRMSGRLTQALRPALELGRSFVRPEAQRSYSPLLLLWRGIGAYVARHPDKYLLVGPVSVSNDYHPRSQDLLVRFLRHHRLEANLAREIRARHHFRPAREPLLSRADLDSLDLTSVSDLIAQLERDGKGVPVLLRQYLKLGGRILGFNVDPAFSQVVDCLLMVDLRQVEPDLLEKYLGQDGAKRLLAGQQAA